MVYQLQLGQPGLSVCWLVLLGRDKTNSCACAALFLLKIAQRERLQLTAQSRNRSPLD